MKKSKQLSLNPALKLANALRDAYAKYAYSYANDANAYALEHAHMCACAHAYSNTYASASAYAHDNAGQFKPLLKHESFMIKIILICQMREGLFII